MGLQRIILFLWLVSFGAAHASPSIIDPPVNRDWGYSTQVTKTCSLSGIPAGRRSVCRNSFRSILTVRSSVMATALTITSPGIGLLKVNRFFWPAVGHTRAELFTKHSIMRQKKPAGSCSRSATSTRLNDAYADSDPVARYEMLIAAVRASPSAGVSTESCSDGLLPDASCPRVQWAKPSTML